MYADIDPKPFIECDYSPQAEGIDQYYDSEGDANEAYYDRFEEMRRALNPLPCGCGVPEIEFCHKTHKVKIFCSECNDLKLEFGFEHEDYKTEFLKDDFGKFGEWVEYWNRSINKEVDNSNIIQALDGIADGSPEYRSTIEIIKGFIEA